MNTNWLISARVQLRRCDLNRDQLQPGPEDGWARRLVSSWRRSAGRLRWTRRSFQRTSSSPLFVWPNRSKRADGAHPGSPTPCGSRRRSGSGGWGDGDAMAERRRGVGPRYEQVSGPPSSIGRLASDADAAAALSRSPASPSGHQRIQRSTLGVTRARPASLTVYDLPNGHLQALPASSCWPEGGRPCFGAAAPCPDGTNRGPLTDIPATASTSDQCPASQAPSNNRNLLAIGGGSRSGERRG